MFNNLKSDGLEESQDRLGGFNPLDSGIYTGKIKVMYAGKSSGGATSISLIADFNGKEYRETLYVTNKKGENYFLNKQDNSKKVPLPGFTIVDDICLITTGKPLAEQDTEDKVINIYNYDEKKEVATSVPMLTACIGQEISLAILNILENKNEKVGDEYVSTADTRTINNIDKVFHPEVKITVAEARSGREEPKFWGEWEKANKDQVRDKRSIKDGQAGATGRPTRAAGSAPAAGSAAPQKSLFGKK